MIKLAEQYDDLPINQVIHGDALAVLKSLPDNSIDALVTDPPAGISFMGREFDHDKGGRKFWIAWLAKIMAEALRVLKPGGHAYVWALPRTSHWTATALEDAGFEIRDCTVHLFGTGFPKSHNISVAIDKLKGAERERIGRKDELGVIHAQGNANKTRHEGYRRPWNDNPDADAHYVTKAATPEALAHEGEGTALKPASEHWWLCRKPLSEPTIAENVLKWGTGSLFIDKTRIGNDTSRGDRYHGKAPKGENNASMFPLKMEKPWEVKQGRWPANVVMSHSLFCVQVGTKKVQDTHGKAHERHNSNKIFGNSTGACISTGYTDADGYETIEDWECSDDCPIKMLGEQSGIRKSVYSTTPQPIKTSKGIKGGSFGNPASLKPEGHDTHSSYIRGGYADEGTAARYFHNFSPDPEPFFYAAKPSRRERNAGCEELPSKTPLDFIGSGIDGRGNVYEVKPAQNIHPCVKSQQLMRHLIRQITPTGGIVLDCFAGSGSTLVACIAEGYHFIGIEMNDTPDEPYVTIARARIEQALREVNE